MFKNAVIRFVAQVLFTLYTGVVVCMLAMAAHSVIITYAYMQWEPAIAAMIPAVGILGIMAANTVYRLWVLLKRNPREKYYLTDVFDIGMLNTLSFQLMALSAIVLFCSWLFPGGTVTLHVLGAEQRIYLEKMYCAGTGNYSLTRKERCERSFF